MVNHNGDVFDVTLFDKDGNEYYFTHIKKLSRVVDWLAERCLDDPKAWKATIYGQHYQYGEVNLAELHDKLVLDGYVY